MRLLAGGVAGLALVLVFAPAANGGMAPDPRPGDTLLGKSGGIAYVSDPEFAAMATSIEGGAACPEAPGRWHVAGGGFGLSGGADASHRVLGSSPGDLLDFYGDDDLDLDDYWDVSATVSVGTTVTTYATCTKWDKLKQKRFPAPDGSTGERKHKSKCGRGEVSGGGGHISSGNSYVSSMHPRRTTRWRFSAFDAAGGPGGMDNYVICARGRDFQTVKAAAGVPAGGSSVLIVAECFPGQSVVGGGAKSSGAPGTLSLLASHPYDAADTDSIPSDGWAVRAFSTDPGAQTLKAYAICSG